MRLIFFSKYSKFNVDIIKAIKNPEKVFGLEVSPFELVAVNSPDSNEIVVNAVIVLTNCPKTSDLTRTNLFYSFYLKLME